MTTHAVLEAELDGIGDIDPVEEMRLRTWARRNYTPADERDTEWHPIVLEEMIRKDHEELSGASVRPH